MPAVDGHYLGLLSQEGKRMKLRPDVIRADLEAKTFLSALCFEKTATLAYLLISVFTLCSTMGCSKRVPVEEPVSVEIWSCDESADEAMKRRDYLKSLLLHKQFLRSDPGNGLALYHLGYSYGQTGNHEMEASYYEKAITLGYEDDAAYFNLGMAYGELGQLEKSIDAFKEAIAINPNRADHYYGLGLAYDRMGAGKLAEEAYRKAIHLDPEFLHARLGLSMVYADRGEFQKAADQLRKILELDPNHREARELLEKLERK
jgi:tetratricopeptide (TPR) repeat protein